MLGRTAISRRWRRISRATGSPCWRRRQQNQGDRHQQHEERGRVPAEVFEAACPAEGINGKIGAFAGRAYGARTQL
jgi:hypothetical protein